MCVVYVLVNDGVMISIEWRIIIWLDGDKIMEDNYNNDNDRLITIIKSIDCVCERRNIIYRSIDRLGEHN